jgi:Bifunctional DNA primase/polymerase, N-terminal
MTSDIAVNARLDAALALARNGFKVFPIRANSKEPAIKNWQTLANDSPELISKWWGEEFPNANIGISTEGLCVIDVDPRNGGNGSWDALMMVEDMPDTATSQTQSGGVHHIFKLPDGLTVPKSRSKLGKGIDIKSGGGYIVAPGSEIEGRPYKWFDKFGPDRLAPTPQWLLDQARAPRVRSSAAGQRVADESTEVIALAVQYMSEHAPKGEEGSRDNTAFSIAAKLFDYGVSEVQPGSC